MIRKLLQGIAVPSNDITAGSKLFTLEMLGSVIVTVFLMSGMWFGLTSSTEANTTSIDANTRSIDKLRSTQADLAKNVVTIDKNVATLLVRQEAASKAAEKSNARTQHDLETLKIFIQRMHSK